MIYVLNKFQPNPYQGLEIDTTSHSNNKDLSPFYLGPVPTYIPGVMAQNVENLWQYSKVYCEHANHPASACGLFDLANSFAYEPSDNYYYWRDEGWAKTRAVRYPMGKGTKPMYSYWDGQKLGYIEARKAIYVPTYANAVLKTQSYAMLYNAVRTGQNIILRDFDGYDYIKIGMTLKEVLNNPKRNAGHAFVLAMLLTGTINECLA